MSQPIIRIAVYGTLKRGGWNHDRYMKGYLSVEETTIRGRLSWLSPGIPMLEVPPEDILAIGTTDYLADAALQGNRPTTHIWTGGPSLGQADWTFCPRSLPWVVQRKCVMRSGGGGRGF